MSIWLLLLAAVVAVEFVRIEGKLMSLADQITQLQGDLDTLTATVTEVVAEIADLKTQLGNVITPEQSAAIDAIASKLEKATSDLKSGE